MDLGLPEIDGWECARRLKADAATLGLSAGINFSLRSVLVTATSFTAAGFPREVTTAAQSREVLIAMLQQARAGG